MLLDKEGKDLWSLPIFRGIATPACALVRDDRYFGPMSARQT